MEEMKPPSKKSPWAFGDEAEKILRGEGKKTSGEKTPQEIAEQESEKAQRDFYEDVLTSPEQKKEESFEVDGFGILKIKDTGAEPSLWQCIEPTGDNGRLEKGMEPGYTGEDLMRAAQKLEKQFPDVRFTFTDKRPHLFSYSAKIEKK